MATVEELEAQLKTISEQVAREITNLRIQQVSTSTRTESFFRMMLEKSGIPFDDYIDYIDSYIVFGNGITDIYKTETLAEKVNKAIEFNKTSLIKMYADDLNILPIVQSTGGISKSLLKQIYTLPYTNRFRAAIEEILAADKEEETN